MTDKPETWLWKEPAAPMQAAVAPAPAPTSGEVVVEVDACTLWHERLGYVFGAVHQKAADDVRPQSRIEGHVVEAGEDALFLVDKSVALKGIVPCGRHERCWIDGALACPRKAGADGHDLALHQVIAPASELSVRGERAPCASLVGLDPFKER